MKKLYAIVILALLAGCMNHLLHAMDYDPGMKFYLEKQKGFPRKKRRDSSEDRARQQLANEQLKSQVNESRLRDQEGFWDGVNTNNPEIVRRYLVLGADVNALDNQGYPALMGLARKAHDFDAQGEPMLNPVAKVLLDAGADVNAQSSQGTTALMWALDSGQAKLARLLLDYGADVNLRAVSPSRPQGLTALDIAQSKTNRNKPEIQALIPLIKAKMGK